MGDDLVHQPSEHRARFEIGLMAASYDGHRVRRAVGCFVACGFDEPLGLGALGFDSGLLGLQDLIGYAAFVVELHQLLLLVLQGSQVAVVFLGFFAGDGETILNEVADVLAYFLDLLRVQQDLVVVVLDRFLDLADWEVVASAARTAGLVAETADVFIDPAITAMASIDESATALAEDGALEIVEVLLRAITREPSA